MDIITRAEARAAGLKQYYTGVPCKNGHVSTRRTQNGSCDECVREQKRRTYTDNRDRHVAYMRQYYKDNKTALNQYSRQYYQTNRDMLVEYQRNRYVQLVEYYREYNRQYYNSHLEYFERHNEQYYRDHLDYYVEYWTINAAQYNHYTAKRRAALKRAIPAWVNMDDVQMMYQECKLLSDTTGNPHEVDHIVPLQSDLVCGLHWEGNLQVIPQVANRQKSNKVEQ